MVGVKDGMRNALKRGNSNMVVADYDLEWNLGKCAPWTYCRFLKKSLKPLMWINSLSNDA
jgi:hypothetical protein